MWFHDQTERGSWVGHQICGGKYLKPYTPLHLELSYHGIHAYAYGAESWSSLSIFIGVLVVEG
jgi:hypothetical protein